MPRDNIVAVGVGVLEMDIGALEMAVDVPDMTVGVPKMDIGVLGLGVGVSTGGFVPWVPGAIGTEEIEGDADVLVMDTVFFLEIGAGDTGGGESIFTGKSSVGTGEGGVSAAATLGYFSLPGCINFLMGILNFGL